MPLARYLGIEGGEVVIPGEHFGVGAVWAAAVPLGAAGDGGLVFMAFVADPPDFFVAGGGDVLGGEAAVFLWVPLAGELGVSGGEVCFAGDGAAACAIGAACAAAAAAASVDGCLPVVAVGAGPPYAVLAAAGDGLWCEGEIFLGVPLGEEFFAVFAVAEIGQGFAHGDHLQNKKARSTISTYY